MNSQVTIRFVALLIADGFQMNHVFAFLTNTSSSAPDLLSFHLGITVLSMIIHALVTIHVVKSLGPGRDGPPPKGAGD